MLGTLSAAEGALPRVPVGAGAVTGRDTSRGTGFSAVGCPSRRGARSFPGVTSVAHRGRVEAGGGAGSLPQGRSVRWEGPARSSCPARSADAQENAIGPVDGGGVREEALRGRHAELKDRLRGLSQGFDRLRRVSHQGYGAGVGAGESGAPPAAGPEVGGLRGGGGLGRVWRLHPACLCPLSSEVTPSLLSSLSPSPP